LYEGGTRSPLVVWGPGLMEKGKAGRVNRESVFAAFDLVPSLLEIAGVSPPDGVVFDGESVAGVLVGRSEVSRKAPLFWRRPPDRKTASAALPERLPDLAMREGNWKLLCEYDGSEPQLYDLEKDAGERVNVAGDHAEVVGRMTKALVAWHESMPLDNGAILGEEAAKAKGKKPGK
jgi:arylsulfatase A-like enzyme